MFENVVVGAALDEGTLDALALAKTLTPSGAKLTLVHVEVRAPAGDGDGAHPASAAPLPEPLLTLAADGTDGRYSLAVVTAPSAAAGLHDYGVGAGADLIVVGASRRDRVKRALRRNATHAVLDEPPCAVAVAPAGHAARERVLRAVGVGYDGSLASEMALDAARTLAAQHNATLSAFEAVPPVVVEHAPWSADYDVDRRVAAARERIGALAGANGHAEYGPADIELATFGETVDLLVLGPHEPGDDPHHGTTLSQRVADDAPCALLVLGLGRRRRRPA